MNEYLLNLNENTVQEYAAQLISTYFAKKKEIEILITNMPQKHALVNYLMIEMEKKYGIEQIQKDEVEILEASSHNYLLLSNALLYLERRWNTALVTQVIKRSLDEKDQDAFMSLAFDPREEVRNECGVAAFTLSPPKNMQEMYQVLPVLEYFRSANVLTSYRDAFTTYKVALAYHTDHKQAPLEITRLVKTENITQKNAIAGILLSAVLHPEEAMYHNVLLSKQIKQGKSTRVFIFQTLISIHNGNPAVWKRLLPLIPHLYMSQVETERTEIMPLLHTLDTKHTVLLFEMLGGRVPNISIFSECFQGISGMPTPRIREVVRERLHIPHFETYLEDEPLILPRTSKYFAPTAQEAIFSALDEFFSFFIYRTAASFSHINNILLDYRAVFAQITDEQLSRFLRALLTSRNTLTYKELSVHRLYSLRRVHAIKRG